MNAQDFYEHLDDCVLRVVQQEEPSEAINEHLLRGVANDDDVRQTLDRHMLSTVLDSGDANASVSDPEDDDAKDDDDLKQEINEWDTTTSTCMGNQSGKGAILSKRGNQC